MTLPDFLSCELSGKVYSRIRSWHNCDKLSNLVWPIRLHPFHQDDMQSSNKGNQIWTLVIVFCHTWFQTDCSAAINLWKVVLLIHVFHRQGQAIVQLARTIPNVTIFGVCSKGKHEALAATGLIDHLIDRTDYVNEVRKWVSKRCTLRRICNGFSGYLQNHNWRSRCGYGLPVRRGVQPRLRAIETHGQVHPLRFIQRCHRRDQELLQRCSFGKFMKGFDLSANE